MPVLHNRVSQKELKARMYAETEPRKTLSFYRYFAIATPKDFRDELYKKMNTLNVFGRIYIAHEGINAQVSVPESLINQFKQLLEETAGLENLRLNNAVDDDGKSFWVLKIKVREKIVADGITDPSFDMKNKGGYVDPLSFNKLTEDPDTIVIDMRNHYEYEVGHFENAIEIPSDTFREQLPLAVDLMKEKKDKNIIMYCTGGIRCEKASAFMLHHGFKKVYHLEGGIINYVQQMRQNGLPSKFIGKNFVFDERLGERVTEDVIATCHQCGNPADTHVNCANEGCHLLFIQCDSCRKKHDGCCSSECQANLNLPPEAKKVTKKGAEAKKAFNKSRSRTGRLK